MLGRSSRFLNAGYAIPKYQLPLGGESVFAKSVRSFEKLFRTQPFLFLVRADYNAKRFVVDEIARLGIVDHRVIEFDFETRGQAESVDLGTSDYSGDIPMVVFNIDTIRHGFEWPSAEDFGDGFLEVFHGEGSGWSFAEPGPAHRVLRTAEKDRISDLCSNGMYGFAKLQHFRDAYRDYVASGSSAAGELYIAPLYNRLIERNLDIRYALLEAGVTEHCGVPADYEFLKQKIGA
jgi:hypothetical protein